MTAEPRIFEAADAERALPLVRRIVLDLQAEYPRWREAVGRFELASVGHAPGAAESGVLVASQREVTERAERISGYLTELDQVGCVFKGFEAGLVDFYSLREDRLIFLCWRLGETRVANWHELDAGFAGRRPIDQPTLTGTIP